MTARLTDLLRDTPDEAVHTVDAAVERDTLLESSAALGALLREVGVEPGRVVAVMLPNTAVAVVGLFGVWAAAAVHAPLNPRAAAAEIAATLSRLGPAAIVTTSALAERFTPELRADIPVIAATDLAWQVVHTGATPPGFVHDADVALVQFTSGTTGEPKPVPMRHSTVLDLMDRFIPATRGPRKTPRPNLVPVSLSLWAGIYQVLFAFRRGAAVVLIDRFDTAEFAELVRRFEVRTTVLPPPALTMLADDQTLTDLAPLRTVRSITAPLSPVQARRFRDRFGVVVVNSYGQTELGGQVVGWSAEDERLHSDDKLGSVGRALPGIELRIDDGEVVVRTPATIGGLIDPAFRDRLLDGAWFRTGDLGSVDDDGFLWLHGRVSDLINRGGNKVFPAHVEDVLMTAPNVREAAVVGVADDRLGEVPWAFVVTRDGRLDEAELLELCRSQLTPYKVPVRIVGIDALPRNDVGKVLKRELVARAAASR